MTLAMKLRINLNNLLEQVFQNSIHAKISLYTVYT